MKKLAILGSTGSIGTQALKVVQQHPEHFSIIALSAGKNAKLLVKQANFFKPSYVCISDESQYDFIKKNVPQKTKVLFGQSGLKEIVTLPQVDMVLSSIVGIAALIPTLEAIRAGKDIALASKEVLVSAGHIVMQEVKKYGVNFLPVDSEHAAVHQCLRSGKNSEVENIVLTASGGPFFSLTKKELQHKKVSDALSHPNWNMGKKISIDSATLINKGLEVIEAHWLFDVPYEKIKVLIHRESIVHSMVNYKDGASVAQLGAPDMCMPIQYALCYPDRLEASWPRVNLSDLVSLSFYEPDTETFKGLDLAFWAGKQGGSMPTVFNIANEEAVSLFLENKIGFLDIANLVERMLEKHSLIASPSLDDIVQLDKEIRIKVRHLVNATS